MRIAQVAPLAERVPPKLYGGTERVVSWLTEELVALGHEVTLFASANSKTKAALVPVWPSAIRLSRPRPDPLAPLANLLEAVASRAQNFDVIHFHIDWVHLPLLQRLRVPYLTTMHGRLDLPHIRLVSRSFPDALFVSISDNQREPVPGLKWLATVHHGLPPAMFKPSATSDGYLAFLGRISPEKGPETAIRLARASGLPLKIAAKVEQIGTSRNISNPLWTAHTSSSSARSAGRQRTLSAKSSCPPLPDRLARALRPRHDRGHGVRHPHNRFSARLCAGDYRGRRERIHR